MVQLHHGIPSYDYMHFDWSLTAEDNCDDIISPLGRKVSWGQPVMVSFLNQSCVLCWTNWLNTCMVLEVTTEREPFQNVLLRSALSHSVLGSFTMLNHWEAFIVSQLKEMQCTDGHVALLVVIYFKKWSTQQDMMVSELRNGHRELVWWKEEENKHLLMSNQHASNMENPLSCVHTDH